MAPIAAVHALGLGEIRLRSALNQPMDAEIQLLSVKPGETDGMIVSLAPQDAFLRAGVERPFSLTQLKFDIQLSPDGQPYIHVTTRKPIVEPFLNFLVEVDWPRGRLLKEYTVLLDPPVFMADTATAGSTEAPQTGGQDELGAAVPGAIVRADGAAPMPELLPEPEPAMDLEPVESLEPVEPMVQAQPEPAFASPEPVMEPEPVMVEVPPPEPMPLEPLPAEDDGLFPRVDVSQEFDTSTLPGGAGTTMTAAAPEMMVDEAQPSYVGDTYGPVQGGETLWAISKQLKPQSATVNQMMLALLQYNPEAFFDDNINNLRSGVVLRIPSEAEVLAWDTGTATSEVGAQNALWEQVRRVAAAAEPTVVEEPAPEMAGGEVPVTSGEGDGSRLALVADEQGAESATSVATATTGDTASPETQQELTLAREELSSERLQNQELRDRISELESIVANVENLITLRENEIAELQQTLTNLESQQAAMTPEPVVQPEPVVPEPVVAEPAVTPEPEPVVVAEPEVQPLRPEPVEPIVAEPEPTAEAMQATPPQPEPMPAVLPPRTESKGFVDRLLDDLMAGRIFENPVLLAIIGGVVSLLLVVWWIVRRRGSDEQDAIEVDIEELPDTVELDEEGMTVEAVIDETLDEAEMDDTALDMDDELALSHDSEPELVQTVQVDEVVEDAVQEEAPKDDTIAEADVYLAYGLYSQSEDLLKQALAEHPDRHEYHEKLLETYFASNNKEAFETQAQMFHTLLGSKPSRLWDRVVAMGGELCPENPLFSGAADLDISAQELQPAKPESPDLELDNEELTPDLDFGIDEEETYINTGTDFDTGEIPLVDETIHEDDDLDATQLLSEAPTLDMDDIGKGDTADHMELDTAEVDRVEEPDTVALEGDMEFDITASDLDELGTPTDAFPSVQVEGLDDLDDADEGEDAPVLTSGQHPAVATPTGEYDMSRIQDLIQGGSGETAIIPEIPDELDTTAQMDPDLSDTQLDEVEPEFEDDPGPNYNMGGTAEIPVMDDVDDFELDLEVDAPESDEEQEPSVVSQLVTSVSEDMMDGEGDDEPQLVSEIMPAITDDMLDRTIVQDAASFAGDSENSDTGDEVETMLDLAKAYLDMGDSDSASSALEEIIAAGNDRQRQEAQELLQKIS